MVVLEIDYGATTHVFHVSTLNLQEKKKHNISYSLGLRKDEIYIRFLCVFSTRFC